MFYFVRHSDPDYSERNTKIYQGFGVNLAKLSEKGCAKSRKPQRMKDCRGRHYHQLPVHKGVTDRLDSVKRTRG